jgi:SpoVK/Ycf46/Vps4 family AAA+-type ATPase
MIKVYFELTVILTLRKQWRNHMLIPSLESGITANVVHMAFDKNDRFVLKTCIIYVVRHLERFPSFDEETLIILCWILGEDMARIGRFLIEHVDPGSRTELRNEFSECDLDPDDYARTLHSSFKKTRSVRPGQMRSFLLKLLHAKYKSLRYRGMPEIEKNVLDFKKMFSLSGPEIDFAVFLFIINNYPVAERFFDNHLECNKFIGHKYLANILGLSKTQLKAVFYGKLAQMGLYTIEKWGLSIEDEFFELIQNPATGKFSQNFYFKVPRGTLPLEHYLIVRKQINHILDLIKCKPKSATHLLVYGPPGTGKTSFVYSLVKQLGIPGYEIVRSNENTTEKRRAAILACQNMTNFGAGSIVVVDEADNLLNTKDSWFSRGETQDKGWLNQLLEKPGTRVIWITNRIDGIEDSVLRRFAYSVHFKPFNRRQRLMLWENIVSRNKCKRFFKENDLLELAEKYVVNAGVIDLAVKKSVEKGLKSKGEFRRAVEMGLEAHETLRNYGEKPSHADRVEDSFSLDGLNVDGDLDSMLGRLKSFDEYIRRTGQFQEMNMNLLFYGPPGTGKSELARHIANQVDRKIICKRVSDLQSMYVGEGEKNIKQAFAEAEAEEAVLIIDEADSLLFSRDRAVRSWEISFTNEFLTQMERFRGILVCTTNRLADLDPASLRRFNFKVGFDYLTPEGNVKFYDLFLKGLTEHPLNTPLINKLKRIENLAPGDFKIVRDRHRFDPQAEITHQLLIEALEAEASLKSIHGNKKSIGF